MLQFRSRSCWSVVGLIFIGVALAAADGDGTAMLRFGEAEGTHIRVPVDTWGTFELRYVAGSGGMQVGAAIEVVRRGQWDFRFGRRLQTKHPKRAGYVTASTSSKGASVRLAYVSERFKETRVLRAVVSGRALAEGDEIVVQFGDRSGAGPGVLTLPVAHARRRIYVRTDADADGNYKLLPHPLLVDYVPGPAHHLAVVAPSDVGVDQEFEVLVRAEDKNANVQPGLAGKIILESSPSEIASRQDEIEPFEFLDVLSSQWAAQGEAVVTGRGIGRVRVKARKPGVFRVSAKVDAGVQGDGLDGESNPIRVDNRLPVAPLRWGDLHVHTFLSDGTDPLEENFQFARDVAGLDFVALTDHLHPDGKKDVRLDGAFRRAIQAGLEKKVTLAEWWEQQCAVADKLHLPGRFATLYAYEWSGASRIGGDHNIYFADRVPLLAPPRLDDLYRHLVEMDHHHDVVVIPHVGGRIGNWDFHRPEVETALEICSCHGRFEWFAQEALSRGHRTAFVGAGDNHTGRPGYAIWQRFGRGGLKLRGYGLRGGLAAVRASALDRKELIRALRLRQVYATSGPRILLDFSINGKPMGDSFTTRDIPELSVVVHGTAALDRVEIIRDRSRIARFPGKGTSATITITSLDDSVPHGWHYYYVRVTQEDGEFAWASPIWVNYIGPARPPQKFPAWNDDGRIDEWKRELTPADAAQLVAVKKELVDRAPGRFADIVAIRRVANTLGDYLLFFAEDTKTNERVRIHFYDDFRAPRLHIYPGWGGYGPVRR